MIKTYLLIDSYNHTLNNYRRWRTQDLYKGGVLQLDAGHHPIVKYQPRRGGGGGETPTLFLFVLKKKKKKKNMQARTAF